MRIVNYFGGNVREILSNVNEKDFLDIEEIRIRVDKPLIVKSRGGEFFLDRNGGLLKEKTDAIISLSDINLCLEILSGYSLFALEEEIKQGYFTLPGGHRIGVAGRVFSSGGRVLAIRNISSLNIRIAHEIKGCGERLFEYIKNGNDIYNTLIVSGPGGGKTTLLRDFIRIISNGLSDFSGKKVGVVDERSEIAGAFLGVPQQEVGIRTDVLDGCPKAEGMLMLIRTMSPEVIAVDEIGRREDVNAIEEIMNSGVSLLATVHGRDIDDIREKPVLSTLIERNTFGRYIVLESGKTGKISGVFNEKFKAVTR